MKMKKHLILSMLLLGFAGMLEAENVQRTLPDVVEGVRDEVISLNGEWQFQYAPGEKWERVTVPGELAMQGYGIEHDKPVLYKNTDKQIIDKLADDFCGYAALLRKIKQRVLIAQQRAIYPANEEMLRMYWDIGGLLQQSQEADGWGKKTLQRLAADLKNDYSEIKGFTVRNMQYMVQFFNEYNQELTMIKRAASPNAKSLISHLDEYNFTLPIKHLDWTHNLVLIKQVKDIRARYWYIVQSITNHWTTRYLQEAIKLDDYGKHGALANNFTETLPVPEANDVN